MSRVQHYGPRAVAIVLAATVSVAACGSSRAATPTPPCLPTPALPADWKPVAFPEVGAFIRLPPAYRLSVTRTIEADGRAFGTGEFEDGINPADTTPLRSCPPSGRYFECEGPSEYCVLTVDGRPVYLEAAVFDSISNQGLTSIPGTIDYEFRAYRVSAAWRTGPGRWQVILGHSRDLAGQREMFLALQSLSFAAPD